MDRSLYMKIYDSFVSDIKSGQLPPHTKLPSKRELCALKGVSQSTVETAYGILQAEGYIYSLPKKGYFAGDLISLSPPVKTAAPIKKAQSAEPQLFCRLSTNGADISVFPFSSWAKMTKDTVYNNPHLLSRGEPQGDLELRQQLQAFLHKHRGVVCSPEQIIVGAGMDYLLDIILRLLPKDTVFGLENPGYQATYGVIEASGRMTLPIELDESGMSAASLAESGADVAYITPSHQFPLCITMPIARRLQLLKWASEKDGRYIIEDDYDSEFRYASRPIPAMQGMDEHGKVIYIGTFSRGLAPSIRVAYMVLPPSLLSEYEKASKHMSSTVSRFEQHTLCRFIADGLYSRHLRRAGNLYRQKQALLREKLNGISDLTIRGDEAGLHFLVSSHRMSERDMVASALAEGIGISGLSRYWRGDGCPNGVCLIGFAGPDIATLEEAARRLKKVWSR